MNNQDWLDLFKQAQAAKRQWRRDAADYLNGWCETELKCELTRAELAELDVALQAINENAARHHARWERTRGVYHFKSPDEFVALVIEELGEFVRAMKDCDELPALELIQVGGLVLNALRSMFTEQEIEVAWQVEQLKHPANEE